MNDREQITQQKSHRQTGQGHSQNAPEVTFHLVEMRDRATSAPPGLRRPSGESATGTRGRAREDRQPSKCPSLLRSHSHEKWLAPGLGQGKKPQEHQCLRGPASAHLVGKDDQTTAAARSSLAGKRCEDKQHYKLGARPKWSAHADWPNMSEDSSTTPIPPWRDKSLW